MMEYVFGIGGRIMYFVNEIQNGTSTPYAFEDKATAFEKLFQVAAYIPKSTLEVHTATLTDDKGILQFPPITKDTVK